MLLSNAVSRVTFDRGYLLLGARKNRQWTTLFRRDRLIQPPAAELTVSWLVLQSLQTMPKKNVKGKFDYKSP